jgi:hypothetical protein
VAPTVNFHLAAKKHKRHKKDSIQGEFTLQSGFLPFLRLLCLFAANWLRYPMPDDLLPAFRNRLRQGGEPTLAAEIEKP